MSDAAFFVPVNSVSAGKTLFISDLHLAPDSPLTTQAFLRFAQHTAPGAEALYVLGDLFEVWVGDDSMDEPFSKSIVEAFAAVARNGTALFFMHGNRDFLLGERFCASAGGRLLSDPTLIKLYGAPTLLMHGDTLCTDDVEYQGFRAMVREPRWQADFLARPLAERKAIARGLRNRSEEAKQDKAMDIMDVALPTVDATLRRQGYPRLIHGHTHRPAVHRHMVDGHSCERWVLTDWDGERGGYLEITAHRIVARSIDR